MTILLAWSLDEAGRYIETLKAFEHRQPDIIRERVEDTYMARLANSLTSIKSVNKTDVLTLSSNFGSFEGVAKATSDELSLCPGVGDLKAQRIFKAFHEPGRQLHGRKVRLPENYTGHIVVDSVASNEASDSAFESETPDIPAAEQRVILSAGQFDSLTVWEHDRVPAEDDDEFITSLEWVTVAASIHADCADSCDEISA
ncbi:ssDNA endonuclease and repair protein rad10 [Coemansia sp. RSA 2673]|nr:ssDNA endonuclease and repair protein rad10 [Coemansia sp. RSA 2673]